MQNVEPSLEALATRVGKLEAQNRRLKKVGLIGLLVVAALMNMGQAKREEIVADHIRARSIDADLIQLSAEKANATSLLLPGRILVKTGKNALVSLNAWQEENGPYVIVTDEAAYSAMLGKSDLVIAKTGRTEKTSAASIVLYGKDKKVLWAAP